MENSIRYHRIKCQDIIRYKGNDWITKELSSSSPSGGKEWRTWVDPSLQIEVNYFEEVREPVRIGLGAPRYSKSLWPSYCSKTCPVSNECHSPSKWV